MEDFRECIVTHHQAEGYVAALGLKKQNKTKPVAKQEALRRPGS